MKLEILQALFVGSLLAANAVAGKVIGGSWPQSAGIIAYPITFLVTDAIGEVYGEAKARATVLMGLLAQVVFLGLVLIARLLPHPMWWEGQTAMDSVFGLLPRIVLGSLIAYLVSQYHDVWAFGFWKRTTDGRHLWLRNNASTIVSQAIDTALFVTIAFAGVFPEIWRMMVVQFAAKLLIALVDTPFCYALVRWLRGVPRRA